MSIPTATSAETREVESACRELYSAFWDSANTTHAACDGNDLLDVSQESLANHIHIAHDVFAREKHIEFLKKPLEGPLSNRFLQLFASQPWIIFWCLHGLQLLAEPCPDLTAQSIVAFLSTCQCETGGYGGGPRQIAHLSNTLAAVATLVSIGTDEALRSINRPALLTYLSSLKTPEGAFKLQEDGEVDMRGIYCAIASAHLAGVCTPELMKGVAEYILGCQRYDGGIAGEPGAEAHAGYTHCGLAALTILHRAQDLHLENLLTWLCHRQQGVEGGFNGRANKLVDTCYSFWVGASMPLIKNAAYHKSKTSITGGCWFAPLPLLAYILLCCQPALRRWDAEERKIKCGTAETEGGLCDKPGTSPDFYHTCYALSGMAVVQEWCKEELLDLALVGLEVGGETLQLGTSTETFLAGVPRLEKTCPIFNIEGSRLQGLRDRWKALGCQDLAFGPGVEQFELSCQQALNVNIS